MAISSATATAQPIAPAVWQTLQMQQAQRNAEQARANARSLETAAAQAQVAADQADQQARTIGRQAQQAQYISLQAEQSLTTIQSGLRLQSQVAQLAQNVKQAAQTLAAPPAAATATASTPAPVVNAQGQVTGTVVNVKA